MSSVTPLSGNCLYLPLTARPRNRNTTEKHNEAALMHRHPKLKPLAIRSSLDPMTEYTSLLLFNGARLRQKRVRSAVEKGED